MENIFKTKEEYLTFRKAWRDIHADGLHKDKIKEEQIEYVYSKTGELNEYGHPRWTTEKILRGYHLRSRIGFVHHLIFLAACGKNIDESCRNMKESTINAYYNYFNIWNVVYFRKYHIGNFFNELLTDEQLNSVIERLKLYFEKRSSSL